MTAQPQKGHWPKGKRRNQLSRGALPKLRKLVRVLGSRRKVAAKLGVDWSTVGRWLTGTDHPSPENAEKIMNASTDGE